MNKELEQYIINNATRTDKNLYNKLRDIFTEYSSVYIKNFEEFKNSPTAFFNFLMENIDLIKKCCPQLEEKQIIKQIKLIKKSLGYRISSEDIHREQAAFANIVSTIADSKSKSILDVGAGNIPYSSILLGEKIPRVASMDESFWLGDQCLRNLNVSPIQQFFDDKTNIDDYDMVVGKFPCTAIESIVYLCKKYNKPYLIQTCDCAMPSREAFNKKWGVKTTNPRPLPKISQIQSESGKFCTIESVRIPMDSSFGWHSMLPAIDSDIKFYKAYAYNVGEDASNIERLIKSYENSSQDSLTSQSNKKPMEISVVNNIISEWLIENDVEEYIE